jgi:hypothetical protein
MNHLDYSSQNLQNYSFKGQNLAGANFSGCDLQGCDFTGANLTGANFKWARTGQSSRQISSSVASAVIGPVILIGGSLLLIRLAMALLPQPMLNVLYGALPIVVLILELLFQGNAAARPSQATTFFSLAAIAILVGAMVVVVGFLMMGSLSGFGSGSGGQGLLFLVLVVVGAIVIYRLFTWISQIVQSNPGTSFKKANLTDADFSHARIRNTDFAFATMTGVCIFHWYVNRHTQFNDVYCEYLYLEPQHQKRQPAECIFQSYEAEQQLNRFKTEKDESY